MPLSRNVGTLTSWNPLGHSGPVMRLLYLLLTCCKWDVCSWFQTFTVFWIEYIFFWVIPRRLNFICRRFGTLCLLCGVFPIIERVLQFRPHRVEVFLISNFRRVLNIVFFLLGKSLASEFYMPTFRITLCVPKRRHTKFRPRVISPKKAYNKGKCSSDVASGTWRMRRSGSPGQIKGEV